ncbi:Forkhead box protein N3 [Myotis davidii]|uniref:Forkhead box protein N3 n=1 Tax=Myotis davidii TaxID=225400 RepID=L5MF92_MYODS|nr:Forkhead box protein N3 [Myotis davidii]
MGPVMPPSKKPESSGISVSRGLSQCYRGSGFSKALQEDDDLDFSLPDIRLEEGAMEDEELTNLNWLHESKNLLKSFGESVLRSVSPVQDLDDDTPPSPAHSDMPYDARQNPNCKPPYSFSCLIFMAIEDSPTKRLPVKDIYNWILEHFPYFANAPTGWKNSVRHNLSLNKCFKKVDKERSQHFMSEQRPCPFAGLPFEEEDSPAALESQGPPCVPEQCAVSSGIWVLRAHRELPSQGEEGRVKSAAAASKPVLSRNLLFLYSPCEKRREITLGLRVYVNEKWRDFIDFSSFVVHGSADPSSRLVLCRMEQGDARKRR